MQTPIIINIMPSGIAIMVIHNIIPVSNTTSPSVTVISLPASLKTNPTNHQINKMGQNIRKPSNRNIINPFLIVLLTLNF